MSNDGGSMVRTTAVAEMPPNLECPAPVGVKNARSRSVTVAVLLRSHARQQAALRKPARKHFGRRV
jgi:hypothetical protein